MKSSVSLILTMTVLWCLLLLHLLLLVPLSLLLSTHKHAHAHLLAPTQLPESSRTCAPHLLRLPSVHPPLPLLLLFQCPALFPPFNEVYQRDALQQLPRLPRLQNLHVPP